MEDDVARLDQMIDLETYPIHDPAQEKYCELIEYCHAELNDDGCCSITNFFNSSAIAQMSADVNSLTDQAYRPKGILTAYGGEIDQSLPEDHPRRFQYKRGGGFVGGDLLDKNSFLWQFFDSSIVTEFMMQAFHARPLYQYADPIAGMAINCMWEGDEFPWHFDTNELTVSIQLQAPESGGEFEYVPNIRAPDNEHYDKVKRIFAGDREGVRSIQLKPGDMQLFKGRYTLHRVTEVKGKQPRLVALPSWSSQPNQVGMVERMLHSYGRVLPIHYERAGISPDGLAQ